MRQHTSDRGQTGLDFVVGIGLFLLAMAFLVGFAPDMVASHADGPELPLVADRAANIAAAEIESDSAGFFAAEASLVADYEVKVTLENDAGNEIDSYTTSASSPSGSTAVARRVVDIDSSGTTGYLTVEVWQ